MDGGVGGLWRCGGGLRKKGGGEMAIWDPGMTAMNGADKRWKARKKGKRRR